MRILESLQKAEQLVEEQGDSMWFKEQYTRLREFYSITESVEQALKQQNLWDKFQAL